MITRQELSRIYKPDYFKELTKEVVIKENQREEGCLEEVTFTFDGKLILIGEHFLKAEKVLYNAIKGGKHGFSLSQICDAVLLLEKEEEEYVIAVELKSGYTAVHKKAIYQVAASIIKIKALLNNFESYPKEKGYKEMAIIVSFPPTLEDKKRVENNAMILDRREEMMQMETPQQKMEKRYDKNFRKKGEAILKAADLGIEGLNLSREIVFDELYIKHYEVTKSSGETVNLNCCQ